MRVCGAGCWPGPRRPRRSILNSEALARCVADVALERKARDVVVIDVRGRTSYADFLVVASGTSDRHVQSVAELVTTTLKKDHGVSPLGQEGLKEGQWALIDLGDVVLHVFHPFTREVYSLEALWSEAPRLRLEAEAAQLGPRV